MTTSKISKSDLPAYLDVIYGDIYNSADECTLRDNNFLSNIKTFFQYKRLVNSVVRELKMNQSVLQLGVVFGNEIDEVAMAIGAYGQYDIVDISPVQVNRITDKYWKVYQGMKVFKQDASCLKLSGTYDAVVCFMLLSEVPSATKSKIINNALQMVKPGGKVIFVDWHNPLYYHPLRYVVRMYNRLYHPFAEKLWDRQIDTFAKDKTLFSWRKSLFFGGMYQKVVATRKINPLNLNIVEAEPKVKEDFLQSFYARK